MASMTRDQMRDELKKRGWSRYIDADIELYLGWGLQDVCREMQFPTISDKSYQGSLAANANSITLATVVGGTLSTVGTIEAVFVEQTALVSQPLRPATEYEWLNVVQPNLQLAGGTNEVKSMPRLYYLHADTIYFYPTADKAYDVRVLWTEDQLNFVNGADTSGLPERLDSAVIIAAEIHCNRRARDYEAMAINQSILRDILMKEIAKQNQRFQQENTRVERYRGALVDSY